MWGYWFFFAFESFLVSLLIPTGELALSDGTYIGLILMNSIVLMVWLSRKYRHDSNSLILIIGGFLFRLFLMLWSEYYSHIFTLPNSGADEFTYYYNAMSNLVKGKEYTGYAQVFSWQASIFGLSKLYGKFVNILFSISAILILRRILIRLKIEYNVRVKTIALACFLPNFAILSSLLLRESLIIFFVAASLYFMLRWWTGDRRSYLILSLITSVLAVWLHSGMVAFTLGILCISISAKRTSNGHSFKLLSARTLVFSVITAVVVLVAIMNLDIGLTSYFRGATTLEDIVSIADAYEEGGSAYNANIVSNESTSGFIINTPFRMFYFLFAPVPWNWRNATDVIAFFMSAVFYSNVLFKTILCMIKSRSFSLGSAIFLMALLVLMMFGWGVSNSGTALRHRDKMVIHYLIMYALVQSMQVSKVRKRQSRSEKNEV